MQSALHREAPALEAIHRALALANLPRDAKARRQSKHLWRLKEELHYDSRNEEERQAALKELFRPPPRDPALDSRYLDLTDHYNASLYDGRGFLGPDQLNFGRWPERFEQWQTLPFDVRGIILLNCGKNTVGEDANSKSAVHIPEHVPDIQVRQRVRKVHFLHGVIHSPLSTDRLSQDQVVAHYDVHYEDGSVSTIPVRYPRDIVLLQNTNERNVYMLRSFSFSQRDPLTQLVR